MGKGRGDHVWISDQPFGFWGSLFFPKNGASPFDAVVRVSLAALTVLKEAGLEVFIKWPNDLVTNRKKIAGLLAEEVNEHLVVGLGVNLLQTENDFPVNIRNLATSFYLETQKPLSIREFEEQFLSTYFCLNEPGENFERYQERLAYQGHEMEIGSERFVLEGVLRSGALLGRLKSGAIKEFHSGSLMEVTDG